MFPTNPRGVFLFQALVGLASLVSILLVGRTGLALIAFLAFRPFIFGRNAGGAGDPVKRLYARTFRVSAAATAAFLALSFLAREAGLLGEVSVYLLLLMTVPAYMIIHGATGLLLAGDSGEGEGPSGPATGDRGRPS